MLLFESVKKMYGVCVYCMCYFFKDQLKLGFIARRSVLLLCVVIILVLSHYH